MKVDWKTVFAVAVGLVLTGVVVKAIVGFLPASISAYVPSYLKN